MANSEQGKTMLFNFFTIATVVTGAGGALSCYLAAKVNVPPAQLTWDGAVHSDDPSVFATNKVSKLNKLAAICGGLAAIFGLFAWLVSP
jgi:phage shock protein PspC (stress-responsive transcriptional regulator)